MKNLLGILIVFIGFLIIFSDNITSLISGHLHEQQSIQNQQRSFEEQQRMFEEDMQNQQRFFDDHQRIFDDQQRLFDTQNKDIQDQQRLLEEQQRLADENMQNQQRLLEEQQRLFDQWAMEEANKSVTPFDHGGYVKGYGFNPSDTAAQDMHQQQMQDFNNFLDQQNFNNFGSGMGF